MNVKKHLFPWKYTFIAASFIFSPLAQADSSAEMEVESTGSETSSIEPTETPAPLQKVVSPQEPYGDLGEEEEEEEPLQGIEVQTSTNNAEKEKKKQFWKNIILAGAAVIVAIVSILVVSNNNGKAK